MEPIDWVVGLVGVLIVIVLILIQDVLKLQKSNRSLHANQEDLLERLNNVTALALEHEEKLVSLGEPPNG